MKVNLFMRVVFCAALCLRVVPALCQSTSPTLLKIDIKQGPTFSIEVGKQEQLTASGEYSDNKPRSFQAGDGIIWTTQNALVLSIDPKTGDAAGVAAGTVWVQATDPSSGIGTRVWVTVTAPIQTLQGFYVSPSPVTVTSGGSVTPKVTALYTSGDATIQGSLPSGAKVTWVAPTGDNAQYFSVDPQSGTVTGLKAGSGVFQVKVDGLPKAVSDTQTIEVSVNVAAETATAPDFDGMLIAGESSFSVFANAGEVIEVYQFPDSYHPSSKGQNCSSADIENSMAVQLVTANSSEAGEASVTTSTVLSLPGSGTAPFSVTLSQPLTAGHALCFVERNAKGAREYSPLRAVYNPEDYGMVRSWLIAGIQVSNQLSTTSNNSSAAGEYVEFGLAYTLLTPQSAQKKPAKGSSPEGNKSQHFHPGVETILRAQLSPLPVAATTTTTTTTTQATQISGLNVLSSQNAARVIGAIALPMKLTAWGNSSNYFTLGPLAKAGFGTLLNPSLNSSNATAAGGGASTPQITTASFSPAYSFWSLGGRFDWERYPFESGEAPQTLTALDITLGTYTNLQSYVCRPITSTAPSVPVTSCPTNPGTTAPGGSQQTTTTQYSQELRTLIPRLDIEGFAKLPNFPLILGMDANFQQYTLWSKRHIDYSNKPGNDIRFLFAVDLPLGKLMSVLGMSQ